MKLNQANEVLSVSSQTYILIKCCQTYYYVNYSLYYYHTTNTAPVAQGITATATREILFWPGMCHTEATQLENP